LIELAKRVTLENFSANFQLIYNSLEIKYWIVSKLNLFEYLKLKDSNYFL